MAVLELNPSILQTFYIFLSVSQFYLSRAYELTDLDQKAMKLDISLVEVKFENKIRYCCGTPLSYQIVLTAAHCFFEEDVMTQKPVKLHRIRVLMMETSRKLRPKKLIIHPRYNNSALSYDVALLAIKKVVRFEFNQVLDSHNVILGHRCIVYGHWNNRFETHIDNSTDCHSQLSSRNISFDPQTMLCAGKTDVHHSCFGDSGCPLLCDNGIVGLVSFSTTCKSGYSTVFTRVSEIREWIFSFLPKM